MTQYVGAIIAPILGFDPDYTVPMLIIPIGLTLGASLRLSKNIISGLLSTVLPLVFVASSPQVRLILIEHSLPLVLSFAGSYLLPQLRYLATKIANQIANSWSAIRIGPVRIINYAAYSFASAFVGVIIFNLSSGDATATQSAVIAAFILIGAGVWGQAIEYSGRLARPFGYFGAVLGGATGVFITASVSNTSVMVMGASLALCAPWIQSIGRLRCLVQGCCHGRQAQEAIDGIRYHRQESRVIRLANLADVPLYPTQLYSIYMNLLLGVLLMRLSLAGVSASLIIGVYLIVIGVTRFVEEEFRGEPQVPTGFGLKIYQWFAIILILVGIAVTLIPSVGLSPPSLPNTLQVCIALIAGLTYAFAMGVDFPVSKQRLSRLTPD